MSFFIYHDDETKENIIKNFEKINIGKYQL